MTLHKKIFSLLILLTHLTGFLPAQTYFFRNYTIEDGLAQTQVYCIHQDKKGYLWIGTLLGGVSKFDGFTFINYTVKNGLANNLVYCIAEDSSGNLWFGTAGGLTKYDGKEFKSYTAKDGLCNETINCLLFDSKDILWIGTPSGLCRFDPAKSEAGEKKFTLFEKGNGLSSNEVRSLAEDKEGNLWIATSRGGITKFRPDDNKGDSPIYEYYSVKSGLINDTVTCILKDTKGSMWIGTKNGLSVFSENKFTGYTPQEGMFGNHILNMLEDREGRIWLSMNNAAINIFDRKNFTKITSGDGMPDYNTLALFRDRENNIWLGSDGGGLLRFGGERFVNVTGNAGDIYDAVFPIFEKSGNEYWFGTYLGGILKFDGKNFSAFSEKDGLGKIRVNDLLYDKNGVIWVASSSGLFKFDGKKFTSYTTKDGLVNDRIYKLYEDRDGALWIGCRKGLSIFKNGKFTNFNEKDGLANDYIQKVIQDSAGNYWIATHGGGICKYNGRSFKFITTKDGLTNDDIASMLMDKDGNLWLGTIGGGINQYIPPREKEKKGMVEVFNSDHGLFDDVVIAMTFDKDGNIWAATNKGVDKLDINEFKKSGKKNFTHYGKSEGFLGVECNFNGAFMDSKSNLWFGTIKGAIRYDPAKDIPNTVEPMLHLSKIRMFFEDFSWSKYADYIDSETGLPVNVELPHKQNHLTFDFVGISLTNPEKVRYSYMLEGLDKDWSPPAANNHVTYSSIPPGDYIFMVKASNNDGLWNKEPLKFSFSISPPFWQTWWFYLLVAGSIFGGIRWRIQSLKRDKIRLEKKVAEKTKELREEKHRVEEINREVTAQKSIIEKKNKDITASIQYAKRIQETTLPLKEKLNKIIPDSFILFKPRDIVSGDFYWFTEKNGKIVVAAVDCTGHGVPGAFMSLIGNNLLNEIIVKNNVLEPASILKKLDEGLITVLKKDELDSFSVDGMDIALSVIDKTGMNVEFAAAGRSLVLVRNRQAIELKGNKLPLGLSLRNDQKKTTDYKADKITIRNNDSIYIFSDGFCDQFGGSNGDKFMYGRFEKLLIDMHEKSMNEQEKILLRAMEEWKGDHPQIDDMLVIGMRI